MANATDWLEARDSEKQERNQRNGCDRRYQRAASWHGQAPFVGSKFECSQNIVYSM